MIDQTYADRVKNANDEEFRRVVGIKRTTSQAMVELVDEDYRQVHQRRGRRSKLDPEAKVLITLDYLQNYGTFLELSFKYGVSETTARTIVERVENVLVRSEKKIISGVYRNRRRRLGLRFSLICGTYNFENC